MSDRTVPVVLSPQGGFQTDLPSQSRTLSYWLQAENVIFEVDGAVRKFGGATKINDTVIPSAPNVMGMYDFHRGGGAAAFTQTFVAVTGDGEVYKEDMDGTWDNITGTATIGANATPIFCVAGDLLTIWFSDNSTPLKWPQSGNVAVLGGSPPAGRGAVYHAGRLWTWGANANESRLTFSAFGNVEDYTGPDTGSLDFNPGDGDRIVGAISHKGALIIFKGPNRGSIHVVEGTGITGSDGFRKKELVRGIPLQTHNSIVDIGDDVAFMSNRGIHSLSAVQEFGNFAEKDVTRHLKGFFRDSINRSNLHLVWGINYAHKSCCMWTMTEAGASENNMALGMSYIRLEEEGFKPFTVKRDCYSAALRKHPTTKIDEVIFGGTDGFVRRQDTAARNLDSTTAYNMRLLSPQLLLGTTDAMGKPNPDQPVVLEDVYMRSVASGNYDIRMSVIRDNLSAEEYLFNQGVAGFILGSAENGVLGEDALGGASMQRIYSDPQVIGECTAAQFDINQGGYDEDAYILEIGVYVTPAAASRQPLSIQEE
jgi:hypothetical protein